MKRKHYLLIAALSLSLTTTAAAATLTACGGDDETNYVQVTESVTGTYYFDDNGSEKTIEFGINSFTLNFGDGVKTGWYESYENGTISMVFDNSETASATFDSGIVRLTYNGNTYTLYLKRDFTVSFNTDNGSQVAAQTVRNGRKATRPENPTRENSAFIDWYTDDKFATPFDFENTIITGDTTLYAKFITIDNDLSVFHASFDLGEGIDESYAALETVNRRFYHLPAAPDKEGNKFLGWWTSSSYDRNNLTTKYENQEVYEDTTFYAVWESDAPVISVTPEGANWWMKGAATAFDVTIKNERGDVVAEQHNDTTSIEFNFKEAREGDYTVEVTAGEKTSTVTYKNKALARVAKFSVEDDFFAFGAIDTEHDQVEVTYYMDLICGDETHDHTHQRLNGEGFDFSNCLMKEGGIKFRITAEAVDYAASVSEWFTLERELDAVTGLAVNDETEQLTWNAVENAKGYKLELSLESGTKIEKTVTEASYDLRSLGKGNWVIKVTPVNPTYLIPGAAECSYNKARLASPENITVTDTQISWNAVDGATGYTLLINGQAQTPDLTTNSFTITDGLFQNDGTSYRINVIALGANAAENSLESNPVYIHNELGEIAYADGYVSWDSVLGISKYGVRVGDGEEIFVTDGSNRAEITFTRSGKNTVTVTGYAEDVASTTATVDVDVHEISFDTNGGTACANQYKAAGDTVALPEAPTLTGHTFLGWYNQAENGIKYGGGYFKFDGNNPKVYANWKANEYTVTLIVGEEGTMEEETEHKVTFGKEFRLPAPISKDDAKEFTGWFTAAYGGASCTDNIGLSQAGWNIAKDVTLYAQWGHAGISYQLRPDGKGYTATQGKGINSLTTVTVRATYNGLPVTDLGASAFAGCGTLQKLRLPSSLQSVVTGINPYAQGTSFAGLDALETLEVYDAGGDRHFAAVDNCLYSVANGELDELIFVANRDGRTGTFTVADGTKRLAPSAVNDADNIEEVVIPASVTFIADEAFASMDNLKKATFLPAANGQLGKPLEIRTNVFRNCEAITEITLPKRLATIAGDAFGGGGTYGHIKNLQKIYIEELGETKDKTLNYYDADGVLCKGDEIIYCPRGYRGEFRTPTGIRRIGENAFNKCSEITAVYIGAMIQEIGTGAFQGCGELATLVFDQFEGNEDLTIGENAFSGAALTEVVLPPNLKKLGTNAFACRSLTTVTVNSNRESIEYADSSFTKVTTVTLGEAVRTFNLKGVFGDNLQTVNVDENSPYFKKEGGTIYDGNRSQILFTTEASDRDLIIGDDVEVIGSGLFKGNTDIVNLTIGTGVKRIEASAFEGCTSLETITFKEGGTVSLEIGDRAFFGLKKLATINFNGRGGAEITIGKEAFAFETVNSAYGKNEPLTEITLPEGVTTIGKFAFACRISLQKIDFPASLTSIGMLEVGDEYPSAGDDYALTSIGVANVSIFRSTIANFKTINVAEGNPNYASVDGILYGKENGAITTLLFAPGRNEGAAMPGGAEGEKGYVKVPLSVTKVADFAFYNNNKIKKIEFEAGTRESFTFGQSAFYYASGINTIVLPEGLEKIDSQLFRNSGLTAIEIPDTVTSIGAMAFNSCKNLTQINIPNSVTTIGASAFVGCSSLKTVTFAEGNDTEPLTIENDAFNACKITSLKFPKRLKEIGDKAFQKCTSLATLEIPVTVERIGNNAFESCTNAGLTTVTFTGTVTADTKDMTIGNNAFNGCNKITSFELPANVVYLGTNALKGMLITELTIPARIETLEQGAIDLANLQTLTFDTMTVDGKQVNNLTTFKRPTSQAPTATRNGLRKLTKIDGFKYCTKLTELPSSAFAASQISSITLPAGLQRINASAFAYCSNLTSISIPNTVNYIGNNAFQYSGLVSFTFPSLEEGSIELGKELFIGCADLQTLTISESVKVLGSALSGATVPTIMTQGDNIILDKENHLILSLTSEANRTYQVTSASGEVGLDANGVFRLDKILDSKVGTISEIAAGVFAGQNAMKGIVLPASLQIIGDRAFSYCFSLETVEFAEDSALVSIGANAFEHTKLLKTVALPNSVKLIGANAFLGSGIEEITMPDELTGVGKEIFKDCGRLTTVNNLSKMFLTAAGAKDGSSMFYGCLSLKNVTLADGADTLPSHAFRNCSALETIDLTGVTTFANYLDGISADAPQYIFQGCTSLKTVTLDANLKKLPAGMFDDNAALTTIYRSDTPTDARVEGKADLSQITTFMASSSYTKDLGAFKDCTSLTEVDIRNANSFNSADTFYGCTALEKAVIAGAGYSSLANRMFYKCSALKTVQYWNGSTVKGEENAVTIPDCIEFAGASTFAYSGVEKAVISVNMRVIGKDATVAESQTGEKSQLFQNCAALKEVVLPASLTAIGANVFDGCIALDTVKYRSGSTVTGADGAFTLPSSLKELGSYCFQNCAVTALDLADVTSIGSHAFNGCAQLSGTLSLANAASIGNNAFEGCTLLSALSLPKATTIGNSAFSGCTALTGEVSLPEAVTVNGNAFKGCTGITGIDLPKATTIGDSCFAECSQLSSVNVPKVESVGSCCFSKCIALVTIDISSATRVGTQGSSYDGTFYGCENLTSVKLNDNLEELSGGMFAYCTKLTEIKLPTNLRATNSYTFYKSGITSITLPSKLRYLGTTGETGGSVFRECAALETVTFSNELTFIGEDSFRDCASLSSFTVEHDAQDQPMTVRIRTVGKNAFNGCTLLTSFAFGTPGADDPVPTLGEGAFRSSGLTEIGLPSTLANIPAYAFNGCAALASLEIPAGVTSIGREAFGGCDATLTVAAENETLATDKNGWIVNKTDKTVYYIPTKTGETPADVTEIIFADGAQLSAYMLVGYENVTKITLPTGLTEIPQNAFYGFKGSFGADFTIPTTVEEIGNNAFRDTNLGGEIAIPAKVTKLGSYAFAGTNITKVTLPASLTTIDANAFEGCSNLTTIVFSGTSTAAHTIGNYAFKNCGLTGEYDLSGIKITKIGTDCFAGNTKLTKLTFGANLQEIGSSAFKGCTGLTSVTFGAWKSSSNKGIGSSAFEGCTSLQTVTFSATSYMPQTLGTKCFAGCTSLTTVTFSTGSSSVMKTIGEKAFMGCTSLTSIKLPKKITSVGASAFNGCTNLATVEFTSTSDVTLGGGARSEEPMETPTAEYPVIKDGYGYQGIFTGTKITSFAIPANVTEIGEYAFAGTDIAISFAGTPTLEEIGAYAFAHTNMTSFTVPKTVTYIGVNAFANCTGLASLTFEAGGDDDLTIASGDKADDGTITGAFAGCTALTSVTLPERLGTLGSYAFAGSGVQSVTFTKGEENATIAKYAFAGCTALTSVTTAGNLTEIGDYAFQGCTSISEIVIYADTKLKACVFDGWTNAQKVIVDISAKRFGTITAIWESDALLGCEATIEILAEAPTETPEA